MLKGFPIRETFFNTEAFICFIELRLGLGVQPHQGQPGDFMARDFSKSFYNSKEWKMVRESALRRDNYLCVLCGKPADEVHHIKHLSPDNILDTSITLNLDNLASLCRDCHFAEHKEEMQQKKAEWNKTHKRKYKKRTWAIRDGMSFDENGQLIQISE